MLKWSRFLLLVIVLGAGLFLGRLKLEEARVKNNKASELTAGGNTAPATVEIFVPFLDKKASTVSNADEFVLHFSNKDDYRDYLSALATRGLQPLAKLPALLVLKLSPEIIGVIDPREFGGELSYNYPIRQPKPPAQVFPEGLAILSAYGMTAQEISGGGLAGKGEGIRIAILDSGIAEHPQFQDTSIESYDWIGGSGDLDASMGHGTAVASVLSGKNGLVPEAEILDFRVLDPEGEGTSFNLAQAIVQAVDQGVSLINLSLGLYEDTTLLRDAVRYADENGVIMVAATGNDGYKQIAYPAAYPEVLSVAAIDAKQQHAFFSNQSNTIDFAAPGVGVQVANAEGGTHLISGTSIATPFVTGTLAALLSEEKGRAPDEAISIMKQNLDEGGASGVDPEFGDGIVAWERIRERETSGIIDLAVAAIHLDSNAKAGAMTPVNIVVQNRGTQWVTEADLHIVQPKQEPYDSMITSLAPGQTATRTIYLQLPSKNSDAIVEVGAWVENALGESDIRPNNNFKLFRFRASSDE
jgi:subtilisin family serine protease